MSMIRRVLVLALALVAAAPLALAIDTDPLFSYVDDSQAVGNTNTKVTFTDNHSGGGSSEFVAAEVYVKNTGSVTMYIDFDGVATTSDFPILAGEGFTFAGRNVGIGSIGVITAASTTTCTIMAVRSK